jgi:Rod binding domain-containing protein
MDSAIQGAMMMAQQSPLAAAPKATGSTAKAATAAKEYESVFISLMVNEYGKSIEQQGGFGLASHMQAELLKHQQAAAPQGAVQ